MSFFVISGFLITGIILGDLERGSFSLRSFWERRARRILPAGLAMTAACVAAAWLFLAPYDLQELGESVLAQSAFASNIYFWQESGYFAAPSQFKPMLHTWSLAVEEPFYLCLPLLLLSWRLGKNGVRNVLSALFALSFAASAMGVYRFPEATFYLLPTRAWELLAGALLAVSGGMNAGVKNRRTAELLGWGGLVMVFTAVLLTSEETLFPSAAALLPCLGTVAVIGGTGQVRTSVAVLLSQRLVVFVGLISYSWYLWHWPLVVFAKYVAVSEFGLAQRSLLLVTSFLLAVISWRYIETPFRSRRLLPQRRLVRASVLTLATLLLVGFLLHLYEGIPSRYSPELQLYASGRTDHNLGQAETHNLDVNVLLRDGVPAVWQASSAAQPELLVWGDSHCDAVMPVIRALCQEHGVTAYGAIQKYDRAAARHLQRLFLRAKGLLLEVQQGDDRFCQGTRHKTRLARGPVVRTLKTGQQRWQLSGSGPAARIGWPRKTQCGFRCAAYLSSSTCANHQAIPENRRPSLDHGASTHA